MTSLLRWVVTYLLNSIWQVALLAAVSLVVSRLMRSASWRARHGVAIASLLAAVLLPAWSASMSMHPPSERVAVTVLPFADLSLRGRAEGGRARILRHFRGSLPIAPRLSRTAGWVYLALLLYRAGVLLARWRATRRLLESATPATLPGAIAARWRPWLRAFHLGEVHLLTSELVAGPVTLGVRRPALLVPPDFLATATREELEAALCHEFAHIARRDFAVNLLLEVLSLPIAFHPACRLLKQQIDESRELICDAMAANAATGPDAYARSLLSLARSLCAPSASPRGAAAATNALGIFEANILEKRIMNLIDTRPAASRSAKFASALLGGTILAVAAAGISAFSLQAATAQTTSDLSPYLGTWKTTVNGKPAAIVQLLEYRGKLTGSVSHGDFGVDEKTTHAIPGWTYGTPGGAPIVEASVAGQTLAFKTPASGGTVPWELTLDAPGKGELRIAEALPDGSKLPALAVERVENTPAKDEAPREGGADAKDNFTPPHLLSGANADYTPAARAAKLSGICLVGLTVDMNGNPINVRAIKPLGMGLDENAIKAVRQYRFAPATRNGAPVAVDTKIQVEFRIY